MLGFTTNREPMTEVGGNGAVYINPTNEREAADKISVILTNEHNHFIKAGLKILPAFQRLP